MRKKEPEYIPDEPVRATLDKNGHEIVSSVPLEPPLGFTKEPTVDERIRQLIRSHQLQAEAEAAGAESVEEADDFDVDDDPELKSPYELHEPTGLVEVVPPPAKPSRTPPEGGAPATEPEKPAEGGKPPEPLPAS